MFSSTLFGTSLAKKLFTARGRASFFAQERPSFSYLVETEDLVKRYDMSTGVLTSALLQSSASNGNKFNRSSRLFCSLLARPLVREGRRLDIILVVLTEKAGLSMIMQQADT